MPELPEVQTIVNDLGKKIIGQRVAGFWTDWPKSIKGLTSVSLRRKIEGLKILGVRRLGKNILITLDKNHTLLIHQKMTGHLMVGRWSIRRTHDGWSVKSSTKGPFEDRVNQYIHVVFTLDNGKMLALSDMRKFARIDFGRTADILALPAIQKLGLDALDRRLNAEVFRKTVCSRNRSIKQTLMDPTVVAGIGNIYADDILWSAKVHPARPARTLKDAEIKRIIFQTRRILNKAIGLRGTSVGDYRDTAGKPGKYGQELLVYRKTGESCRRCRTLIQRIELGQRSAHFCPKCQKL